MKMARLVMSFAIVLLVVGVGAAQTVSKISVSASEVNHGVVIVKVLRADKTFELQCNEGMTACKVLAKGAYTMVELPANWGMYECKDVEVYPEGPETATPAKASKLGEYCMIQPK